MGNLNIQKSISKKRLIYKLDGGTITDFAITYSIGIVILLISLLGLIGKYAVEPIIVLFFHIGFIFWMILNLILLRTLLKIKGKDINTNRDIIIKIINESFKDLNIENTDQTIIRTIKSTGFISWGRIITVLLNNDATYINIQSLVRGESISFFHGLPNYLKCKRIANRFSQSLLIETQL